MTVKLVNVQNEDKHKLHNLYQFYLHDLSEYTDKNKVGEDGRFDTQHIDVFWQKDTLFPFFIVSDGELAGFTLVAGQPFAPEGSDFSLLELFVLRHYRRKSVGRNAAKCVFDYFRGVWDIYELETNTPAIRFWNEVINEYTGENYQQLENGNRQRFKN